MSEGISRVSRDLANLQPDSRDALPACFVCFSSFLYPHYISLYYPQNCEKSFREKTLGIHLRARNWKITVLYTFLLVFLTLPLTKFHILWEVFSLNTNYTHSECCELIWSFWEALGHAILWWDAIGDNCEIQKTSKDKIWWNLLVAKTQRV